MSWKLLYRTNAFFAAANIALALATDSWFALVVGAANVFCTVRCYRETVAEQLDEENEKDAGASR